jgi:hypothetical protein
MNLTERRCSSDYWDKKAETIFMILFYPKSEPEDLTANQLGILSQLVRDELK